MAVASELQWVPETLYNAAISAVVSTYSRHRKELRPLPENIQFDIYYKVSFQSWNIASNFVYFAAVQKRLRFELAEWWSWKSGVQYIGSTCPDRREQWWMSNIGNVNEAIVLVTCSILMLSLRACVCMVHYLAYVISYDTGKKNVHHHCITVVAHCSAKLGDVSPIWDVNFPAFIFGAPRL